MSNKTFDQLPSATQINSGDVIPIYQGGVTKKIDASLLVGTPPSTSEIQIPTPILKIGTYFHLYREDGLNLNCGYPELKVHYESNYTAWLNHQPQLWLFRYRNGKMLYNNLEPIIQRRRYAKIVHPTHSIGGTGNRKLVRDSNNRIIYRGSTQGNLDIDPSNQGLALTTEWDVPNDLGTHVKVPNFDFNPLQFFVIWDDINGDIISKATNVEYPIGWPNGHHYTMRSKGKRGKARSKDIAVAFAFVITDPKHDDKILIGNYSSPIYINTYYNSQRLAGVKYSMRNVK